ncbi:MAG: biopolymer transporter ExbD [Desulfobacteraceae bacterium]|jgi:biopolymer transport protein ExbD|nr:MAG: biopolymer transporter ExbD [Desulfobacteraceae bacterium]
MKIRIPSPGRSRVEMIPLIDMMFLVLASFTYGILSMAVHRSLPVHLPSSSTAHPDKSVLLSITIRADRSVWVDKEATTLEQLPALLRQRAKGQTEAGVLLFADRAISYQTLFKVLDGVRSAGLSRISLQAESERGP